MVSSDSEIDEKASMMPHGAPRPPLTLNARPATLDAVSVRHPLLIMSSLSF